MDKYGDTAYRNRWRTKGAGNRNDSDGGVADSNHYTKTIHAEKIILKKYRPTVIRATLKGLNIPAQGKSKGRHPGKTDNKPMPCKGYIMSLQLSECCTLHAN